MHRLFLSLSCVLALLFGLSDNASAQYGIACPPPATRDATTLAAQNLAAAYLRLGLIQSSFDVSSSDIPDSLVGLMVYSDTQAHMLAQVQAAPLDDVLSFADLLITLGGVAAGGNSDYDYYNIYMYQYAGDYRTLDLYMSMHPYLDEVVCH